MKSKDLDIHVVVFKVGIVHEDVRAEGVEAESRRRGIGVEEGSSEKLSTCPTENQRKCWDQTQSAAWDL